MGLECGHEFGAANEQFSPCRAGLGPSRPPLPLADRGPYRCGLCDLASQLDGLAWLDWRSHAGVAAISAALGLLRQRDSAVLPLPHLAAGGISAPEIHIPSGARPAGG